MDKIKVAVTQMRSVADPAENLLLMADMIALAEDSGADLICFPENCVYRGPKRAEGFDRKELYLTFQNSKLIVNSSFSEQMADLLERSKIAISLGSVLETSSELERPYNSHVWVYPDKSVEVYRKIHLFNFTGPKARYQESNDCSAGNEVKVVEYKGFKFGLSICFDVRFPELYRRQALDYGAQVLLVPAAFTFETGKAHWKLLNQARAVENQCYVLAAAQWGEHFDAKGTVYSCFGNSLIVDPWGQVLTDMPCEQDGVLFYELLVSELQDVRTKLPSLSCFCPI